MPTSGTIWQRSATELVGMVRRRELSPVEIVDAFLGRIDALDGKLGAYCTVDAEGARSAARVAERSVRRGDDLGPLHGLPIAVKDLIFTGGLRTVGGSVAYRDFVPDEDDVAVTRIRAAGGIILGKTNVPPFGFGPGSSNAVFGATRNPWGLELTPGGSSGGSAVAIAAGLAPLALGGDGGGSIRIPASFCGIVGYKPTFGVVPLYPGCRDPQFPGFSGWETLEHIGPMARTVDDAALLLDVIAGPDPRDRHSVPRPVASFQATSDPTLQRLRIGCATSLGPYSWADPAVVASFDVAVEALRSAGAIIEEVDLALDDPGPMYEMTVALESDIPALRDLASGVPGAVNPRIEQMMDRPRTFDAASGAIAARKRLYQTVSRTFERVDLLLTPTVCVPPYRSDDLHPAVVAGIKVDDPRWLLWFTMPFNLTGHPAISIPTGWTPYGLPVGIQLVGDRFADLAVLDAARVLERALPWTDAWPPTALDPAASA